MRRDESGFSQAGVQVVLIGLGVPAKAREFRESLRLPFTVLCDPKKQIYRLYGLWGRINFRRELQSDEAVRLIGDVARYGVAKTDSDMLQLGGVFGIEQGGIIRFAHRAERVADNPASAAILAAFDSGQ